MVPFPFSEVSVAAEWNISNISTIEYFASFLLVPNS